MFLLSHCTGHCRHLSPTWDKLAQEVFDKGVIVSKVDVTQNQELGKRFDIKGFPTLLFFRKGQMYKYQGPRTLEALSAFATGGYSTAESKPVPPPPAALSFKLPSAAALKSATIGLTKGQLPAEKGPLYVLGGAAVLALLSVFGLLSLVFASKPKSVKKAN